MTDLFRHRVTVVWAALMAATVVSWAVGDPAAGAAQSATAAALAVAFVKVRYIGLEFMEIRHADTVLRAAFEAWVLVVGGIVVAFYALG